MKTALSMMVVVLAINLVVIAATKTNLPVKEVKATPKAKEAVKIKPIINQIAKQPPGLPASVNVTITLNPTSQPEGTPAFNGYVVTCTWNGSFYRGISTDNLLLVDILVSQAEGEWVGSYTTGACAAPLGIPYALCNGRIQSLPTGMPDNTKFFGKAEIVPYRTPGALPYSVTYKFAIN